MLWGGKIKKTRGVKKKKRGDKNTEGEEKELNGWRRKLTKLGTGVRDRYNSRSDKKLVSYFILLQRK